MGSAQIVFNEKRPLCFLGSRDNILENGIIFHPEPRDRVDKPLHESAIDVISAHPLKVPSLRFDWKR